MIVKKLDKYEVKRVQLEEGIQQKIEEFENQRAQNIEIQKKVKQLEQLTKQLEVKDGNQQIR